MKYYLNMAHKYANIRTFSPENGTGTGEAGAGDESAANDDAAAGAESAANADPQPSGDASKAKVGDAGAMTVEQLQAALEAAKAEKAELLRESMERKAKLKAFEGVDPDKYRALVAAEAQAEQAAAEARGDFERVKQMMADAHASETKTLQERIAELEGALNEKDGAVAELTVGNAFGNSTFIKDNLVLTPAKTRVLYGAHFETVGGAIVGYDKPKGAADRTMLVDASGKPLSFEAALEKIVDADPEKKSVLRWKARQGAGSGSDASGSDAGKPEAKPEVKEEVYGVSRIALGLRKK